MSLDRALAISFIVHLLIVAPLFFLGGKKYVYTEDITIDLLNIGSGGKKQEERKKKRVKSKPKKTASKKAAPKPDDVDKSGTDTKDVKEQAGGGINDPAMLAVATYARELQSFIERNKYYPRRAQVMEQTGIVKVRLTISKNGYFESVEIIEGTQHSLLNKAAKDLVTELRSFKPLPQNYRGNGIFIVPINYYIRAGQ